MLNNNDAEYISQVLPFWSKLTEHQREMIISGSSVTNYKKDQLLHCGEMQCIGMLIVCEGSLRTFITSEEGREVTLYRLGSGEICILSASCVLQAIEFDVSIVAEADSRVLALSPHLFAALSSQNINVELFSYKLATERFSDVMWAMQQILFTSFDKRLAAFLLDEAHKQNSTSLRFTHEQIAKYLGSAREVVSRMLKYFAKEGLVQSSRGHIDIIDMDGLKTLAYDF